MKPIDSLRELIDNSIDSLLSSDPAGLIKVNLPSRRDFEDGSAVVRVRDNGPGMTEAQVRNCLSAGFSSKARRGQLGLFGVGFNIATGKLGRTTTLVTARAEDDFALEAKLDLVELKRQGKFVVPIREIPKPEGLPHGTLVDVSQPWGENNQNHGFMLKLATIGRPKIQQSLGRTYASILRESRIRIQVEDDTVAAFQHCIWDDSRFVDHTIHGKIAAVKRFENYVIHTELRCVECDSIVEDAAKPCQEPGCGCTSTATVSEKISGWVGIQRFLDDSNYGIDLIRNGRAIRVLEKEAFFTFKDNEGGNPIVDYPVDDRTGRIVGEVHLNHVPVDPAKQDFERNSPEWTRAVEFLRGKSSFQPRQLGAEQNVSPLFMLFQGYRKVREPGTRSMYPGKWLPGQSKPVRLSKEEIEELYNRFLRGEPGYVDDSKWWEQVLVCDTRPVESLKQCPECSLECSAEEEVCPSCPHIFIGKLCINAECSKTIQRSAVICPHCAANQIPTATRPWECQVCGTGNTHEEAFCATCNSPMGTGDPLSKEELLNNSAKHDACSLLNFVLALPTGNKTSSIDVSCYLTKSPIIVWSKQQQKRLPLVRFVDNNIDIFIDPQHPLFKITDLPLQHIVAAEVALYVLTRYQSDASRQPSAFSLTKVQNDIMETFWDEYYRPRAEAAAEEIEALFSEIKERLRAKSAGLYNEIYTTLSGEARSTLIGEISRSGRDPIELKDMCVNGEFILFLSPLAIIELMRSDPKLFFDGTVWSQRYQTDGFIEPEQYLKHQMLVKSQYLLCLETVASFLESKKTSPDEVKMADAACSRLREKL
ncbi:MAG: ATP-binding protein [Terrimicrobiaceae bacterium]|nr:ATP-binding protein [Terrimicrobiaceae bacterium]